MRVEGGLFGGDGGGVDAGVEEGDFGERVAGGDVLGCPGSADG